MKRLLIEVAFGNHLETLRRCGGYYCCPKDATTGRRLGPLVGYAGTYADAQGKRQQFVGNVYANFAKLEPHENALEHVSACLADKIKHHVRGPWDDAIFCGAPLGGYRLADALASNLNLSAIWAEKECVALATATARARYKLIFSRHEVVPGADYIIVEDVCNNFSTTGELIDLIEAAGGRVIAIVCFLNRSLTVDTSFNHNGHDYQVLALVRQPIDEWRQDDPAVAEDVRKGNIVLKPKNKDDWACLMRAMSLAEGQGSAKDDHNEGS